MRHSGYWRLFDDTSVAGYPSESVERAVKQVATKYIGEPLTKELKSVLTSELKSAIMPNPSIYGNGATYDLTFDYNGFDPIIRYDIQGIKFDSYTTRSSLPPASMKIETWTSDPGLISKKQIPADLKFTKMTHAEFKGMGFWNNRLEQMIADMPDGAYIAGGYLRALVGSESSDGGDVDIFFANQKAFMELYSLLGNPQMPKQPAFRYYKSKPYSVPLDHLNIIDFTSEALFRPSIQLIRREFYESAEQLISKFDFTACQIAVDKAHVYMGIDTLEDIKMKRLRINTHTGNHISTLNRVLKYKAKGYRLDADKFAEIERLAGECLRTPKAFNETFYADWDEAKRHGRPSYLKYACDYFENSPEHAVEYEKAIKKKRLRGDLYKHISADWNSLEWGKVAQGGDVPF